MTRAIGVDLGERRIGIAVSDPGGVLASPYAVIERSGDASRDREALAAIVAELEADVVVVGLPLSLSGGTGRAARAAAEEADALASVLGVPVTTFDERLTTVEAARRRRERGAGGAGGRGGRRAPGGTPPAARPRRRTGDRGIDAEAAAVMLGAWLESRAR